MSTLRAAQQAWDNAQPPDTSRQEREHEQASNAAFDRYLESGDLPGGEDASHVWGELEDDGSELILFDMLKSYRADNDTELLELARIVAARVDNIVNEKIEDAV